MAGCASVEPLTAPAAEDHVLIHPPYQRTYACSEHYAGQFDYLGDRLGTDCWINELVEREGRLWTRKYRADGLKNEDWFGWRAEVLAPCDCKVDTISLNPTVNLPGKLGKPPASVLVFSAEDGTKILYAHVREVSVAVDDRVTAGQVVARVGNNGFSRQPHVHIGAWRNKQPLQIRFDQTRMATSRDQ